MSTQVTEILSDLIDLPEKQMRRDIDRDELYALAENIKQHGLINPITVRPIGDRFELVAGQRRLLALRIAGIIRVPCVVRDVSDDVALNIMCAENIERRDVDLVDEANFIKLAMDVSGDGVARMAERIGRSEGYVKSRLAVGEMPDYMQAFLKSGELKLGSALNLMAIEPDEKRRLWVGMAVQQNSTERETEYWAYQHRLGTLPGTITSESDVPGAPPVEYVEQTFTCAVDGKKYPQEQCQAVFVYKGNLATLEALRQEYAKDDTATEHPPTLKEELSGAELH